MGGAMVKKIKNGKKLSLLSTLKFTDKQQMEKKKSSHHLNQRVSLFLTRPTNPTEIKCCQHRQMPSIRHCLPWDNRFPGYHATQTWR